MKRAQRIRSIALFVAVVLSALGAARQRPADREPGATQVPTPIHAEATPRHGAPVSPSASASVRM